MLGECMTFKYQIGDQVEVCVNQFGHVTHEVVNAYSAAHHFQVVKVLSRAIFNNQPHYLLEVEGKIGIPYAQWISQQGTEGFQFDTIIDESVNVLYSQEKFLRSCPEYAWIGIVPYEDDYSVLQQYISPGSQCLRIQKNNTEKPLYYLNLPIYFLG